MKELTHFAASVALVLLVGAAFVVWGGWIIMGLVIGLPLLDYLMPPNRKP